MDVSAYLSGFDRAERIKKGMAGDEKYHLWRGGEEFLLRIADGEDYDEKKREFEHLKRLNEAGLPVPKCCAFFRSDDGAKAVTLLSWIPGEDLEDRISKLYPDAQYALGRQAGEILRRIHETCPVQDGARDWQDRYFETIRPRLDAYQNEGIPFDGADRILRFIEENGQLMHSRPMCRHHGDFHTGNLIVKDGRLWVIDWHTMDFESVGDPWYEFNRIDAGHPAFARGQIDGYFPGGVPDEFWRLFALYLSVSAITSIVWAKYFAPQELPRILRLNKSVLQLFDGMENPIPKWYRSKEWVKG